MKSKIDEQTLRNEYLTNNLTIKSISEKYNISQTTILKYLRLFEIKLHRNLDKRVDLVDRQFNKLKVLEYHSSTKDGRCLWKCKCECGNIKVVNGKYLLTKHTGSCGKCPKDIIPNFIFLEIQRQANRRNIQFNLSKSYLEQLLIDQNFKCKLSKLDLYIPKKSREINQKTASLDRIDSNKGYIKGNVQFLHKIVNYMKMDLQQEEFIKICQKIGNNND